MTRREPHLADANQIRRFVTALFRHADPGTFVALRSFYEDKSELHRAGAHLLGKELDALLEAAIAHATSCAHDPRPVVFCPPIATFNNPDRTRETDLANGLALSVECDQRPQTARARLEAILGPVTIVVSSGGRWTDPATGELQDKLHLHWRLTEPTREPDTHRQLKHARRLAAALVGADASNGPVVHSIRWSGSWHRKAAPRMAEIVAETEAEIELADALELLEDAARATKGGAAAGSPKTGGEPAGETRGTSDLVHRIVSGESFHGPLTALAMRYFKGGMAEAQIVLTLRGLMDAVPADVRDTKAGSQQAGRWQARFWNRSPRR